MDVFQLTSKNANNEHPEVYHGWKKLHSLVPESEALKWLQEICNQIDECKIKYEWNSETNTFFRDRRIQ